MGIFLPFSRLVLADVKINVSEFLQLIENRGDFLRPDLFPRTWNDGIVEYWNVDFKGNFSLINFLVKINTTNRPLFHYSNIPIVSEAN